MRQTTPTRRKATRNRLIENLETRRLLATFTVDTVSDVTDELDGLTTLREAVLEAEASPGADEIVFDPTVFATPQTITLAEGQILIGNDFAASDLTITDSAAGVTLDANDASRHFGIDGDTTDDGIADPVSSLTLVGLTLTGGTTNPVANPDFDPGDPTSPEFNRASGGSIFVEADATLIATDTSFLGNTAGDGGAIFTAGVVELNNVTGDDNVASDTDGASLGGFLFAVGDGPVTLTGGSYDNNDAVPNFAGASGGWIRADISAITFDSISVSNSDAPFGGAFLGFTDDIDVINSTFTDNAAEVYGGAFYQISSDGIVASLEATGSTFTGNSAEVGGALFVESDVIVTNSTFTNNTATFVQASADQNFVTGDGAAIYQNFRFGNGLGSTFQITDSTFDSNTAGIDGDGGGGAFFSDIREPAPPAPAVSARNGVAEFATNEVTRGMAIAGGSLNPLAAELQAVDKSVVSNAPVARTLVNPDNFIVDSTFSNNVAVDGTGGGVFVLGDGDESLLIDGSTFDSNEGDALGGGFTQLGALEILEVNASRFVGNESSGEVGGAGAGGGIFAADTAVVIKDSEFSENTALNTFDPVDPVAGTGTAGFGGAFNFQFSANPSGSEVYPVQIVQSTFSGNTADARAFGIVATFFDSGSGALAAPSFDFDLIQSTVVFNSSADGAGASGGLGLQLDDFSLPASDPNGSSADISNSILAGNLGLADLDDTVDENMDGDPENDFVPVADNLLLSADASLGFGPSADSDTNIFGTDIVFDLDGDPGTPSVPGPLATDTPDLAPLAFNGGTTRNHLPNPSSNAVDNGDIANAVAPGPDGIVGTGDDVALVFDQRGAPFDRVFDDPMVVDDVVDIGAVELSAAPPEVVATSYDASTLEVVFEIDQDVSSSIDPSDLIATNVTTATQIDTSTVTAVFLPGLNLAVFSLVPLVQSGLLTNGNYEFSLDTAGVANSSGATLVSSPVIEDFFLAGDADRSRSVNLTDFGILRSNFNSTPVNGFLSADFNLDGAVNLTDFGILRANFGQSVAAPADSLFSDEEL